MAPLRWSALITVLCGAVTASAAQPTAPPPPPKFDATVHYRIRADRNGRLEQFGKMLDYFDTISFAENQDDDEARQADRNSNFELMRGTVDGDKAKLLLLDPRVRSILLVPLADPPHQLDGKTVKVKIRLSDNLPLITQRELWFQVRTQLELAGYLDQIGYDHERFSVLRGVIPPERLRDLLNDARGIPGGWLLPETPYEQLPEPLRSTDRAIRVIEVQIEPKGTPAATGGPATVADVPADKPFLAKLAPEVRAVLADPARAEKPLRVEIIFDATVNMDNRGWRKLLLDLYSTLAIEGQLGPIVTLNAPQGLQIAEIAQIPQVLTIRLPRDGSPAIGGKNTLPPPKEEPKQEPKKDGLEPVQFVQPLDALACTRLSVLHAQGLKGGGVRLLIIDNDFSGLARFAGNGGPLQRSKLIDLTAERNFKLEPEPVADPAAMGHGTHLALAAVYAAPNADLTLIRIDGSSPYQLQAIARAITGESKSTEALTLRFEELRDDTNFINRQRELVNEQYRLAFENFDDTPAAKAARQAAIDAVAELDANEREFQTRVVRLTRLQKDIGDLEGIQVVVSPFVWNTGHAIDGTSALSRFLDATLSTRRTPLRPAVVKVRRVPVWLQAAGDTRDQGWTGPFLDRDGNGVMEFCEGSEPRLAPGSWTPELNFLSFQKDTGERLVDLPQDATIRVAVQWREPFDPNLPDPEDTLYREPLANLQVLVLRQRDPSGKFVPSDELELVGFSQVPAQRLAKDSGGAAYEQSIEVKLPSTGRYVIRVEGRVPTSVRPFGIPSLPANERTWEPNVRVFVEATDAATRAIGRPVLRDYVSGPPGVGTPGDAMAVRTVGAAGPDNQPRGFSAFGAGPGLELMYKPTVLAYDFLPLFDGKVGPARGTPLAAAFAGGTAATMISAGAPQSWMVEAMGIAPGRVFVVPDEWLRRR